MKAVGRRTVVGGAAAACMLCGFLPRTAGAAPVTLRIGYGGAAQEPLWLLIARPGLGKNYGKAYTLDAIKFQGSVKAGFQKNSIDIRSLVDSSYLP